MASTSESFNTSENLKIREAKNIVLAPTDVNELSDSYVYTVDTPGIKSCDIKVEVEDENVLVISGERKKERVRKGGKFKTMERQVGKFTRKFSLPENANPDKITAVYQDGVLRVRVEKAISPEQKKPTTTIDVEKLSLSPVERKKPNTIVVKVNWCSII